MTDELSTVSRTVLIAALVIGILVTLGAATYTGSTGNGTPLLLASTGLGTLVALSVREWERQCEAC